jgi:hypothetical protein
MPTVQQNNELPRFQFIAAVDAHVDQINDALQSESNPVLTIRLIMESAKNAGVEEIVFNRIMENRYPNYNILVRMLAVIQSVECFRKLAAFARNRGELSMLRIQIPRLRHLIH